MSQYEAVTIDGKTVWLPKQQEAQPAPRKALVKPSKRYAVQRVGKRYGERKTWW
jgi:hypothetical protein